MSCRPRIGIVRKRRYICYAERRWVKRQTSKVRRRLEKLLGEDAPTILRQVARGWAG